MMNKNLHLCRQPIIRENLRKMIERLKVYKERATLLKKEKRLLNLTKTWMN